MTTEILLVKELLEDKGLKPVITKMGHYKKRMPLSVPYTEMSASIFGEMFKNPKIFHVGTKKFISSDYLLT